MIEFIKSYACSDGNVFATLERAQEHEIISLLKKNIGNQTDLGPVVLEPATVTAAAVILVSNADKVVDILTTTAKSRPKARKINGGKKTRKKPYAPLLVPNPEKKRDDEGFDTP